MTKIEKTADERICGIEGVIRELDKAGFVIVEKVGIANDRR